MDLASFHPPLVHFTVALLFVGVLFRAVSFVPRLSGFGPTAALLLVAGAVFSVLAVESGIDAHGPAEHIPGAAEVVHHHEEWGERVRTLFIGVALLEMAALLARSRLRLRRWLSIGSLAVGLAGLFALYEAAEHGGDVVYSYAGGVGTRTGDPGDVGRLLRAGLYHQALLDREQGRPEEGARLIDEMLRRNPQDPEVQLLAAESQLRDRNNAVVALAAVDAITVEPDDARMKIKTGFLRVDVLVELGRIDDARQALEALAREFPNNGRVEQRIRTFAQQHG